MRTASNQCSRIHNKIRFGLDCSFVGNLVMCTIGGFPERNFSEVIVTRLNDLRYLATLCLNVIYYLHDRDDFVDYISRSQMRARVVKIGAVIPRLIAILIFISSCQKLRNQ